MKKGEVIWSESAKNALREIVEYIKKDSPVAARRLFDAIHKQTTRLESFPQSGRVVPEFQIENLREIIHGNYRIVYETHDRIVSILTVFHGKRLLKFSDLKSPQGIQD